MLCIHILIIPVILKDKEEEGKIRPKKVLRFSGTFVSKKKKKKMCAGSFFIWQGTSVALIQIQLEMQHKQIIIY